VVAALLAGALVYDVKVVLGLGLLLATIPLVWHSPATGLLLMVGAMQLEYLGLFTDPRSVVTVSVPKIIGLLTLAAWGVRLVIRRERPVLFTPELALLGALTALSGLSLAWAFDVSEGLFMMSRLASLLLIYLLMVNLVTSREILGRVVVVLVVSTFALSAMGLLQLVTRQATIRSTPEDVAQSGLAAELDPTEQEEVGELVRVASATGSSHVHATLLVIIFPLFFYVVEFHKGTWYRRLTAGMLTISVFSLALTYSRMGTAVFFISLILLAAGGVVRVTPLRLACAAGVVALALLLLPPSYFTRVFSPGHYSRSESINLRTELLQDSLGIIRQHWFLGVGINNLKDVLPRENPFLEEIRTSPHNMYVTILGDLGILGLVLYLGFFWQTLRSLRIARRHFRADGDAAMAALAVTLQVSVVVLLLSNLALDTYGIKAWWSVLALSPVLRRLSGQPQPDPAATVPGD
jgi:O-antigen ligase